MKNLTLILGNPKLDNTLIRVKNDQSYDLLFDGELLARSYLKRHEDLSPTNSEPSILYDLRIYTSTSSHFICERIEPDPWDNSLTINSCAYFSDVSEVTFFFGHSSLALDLYRQIALLPPLIID